MAKNKSIKLYDKALGIKPESKIKLSSFKAPFSNAYNRVKLLFTKALNPLNRLSFSTLFVIAMIIVVISIFVANSIRMNYFVALLDKNYPEVTRVAIGANGQPVSRSIIDVILADFNAVNNAGWIIVFYIGFRSFIWGIRDNFIPRKPQVWRK